MPSQEKTIFQIINDNQEGINRYVVDNKPKYKNYKYFLFTRSYMRHSKDKDQNKDHKIGSYKIDEI